MLSAQTMVKTPCGRLREPLQHPRALSVPRSARPGIPGLLLLSCAGEGVVDQGTYPCYPDPRWGPTWPFPADHWSLAGWVGRVQTRDGVSRAVLQHASTFTHVGVLGETKVCTVGCPAGSPETTLATKREQCTQPILWPCLWAPGAPFTASSVLGLGCALESIQSSPGKQE